MAGRSGAPEDALAATNEIGYRNAVRDLGHMIPGVDFDALSNDTDSARFQIFEVPDETIQSFDIASEIGAALSRDMPYPKTSLASGGETGHKRGDAFLRGVMRSKGAGVSQVRSGPLAQLLRTDHSFILNSFDLHSEPTGQFAGLLERVFGVNTNVNTYLSCGSAEGFGAHWDNHDVLILPLVGSKTWRIYEPVDIVPHTRVYGPSAVTDRLVWEGEIAPGMGLFIPRGYGHLVSGNDALSIHHTVGINRLIAASVISRAFSLSFRRPRMRANYPRELTETPTSYQGSVFDNRDALLAELSEIVDEGALEANWALSRSTVPPRNWGSFEQTWTALASGNWDNARIRLVAPTGVHLGPEYGNAVAFAAAGRLMTVLKECLEPFWALASGEPTTVSALPDCSPGSLTKEEFVSGMVLRGLVEVGKP